MMNRICTKTALRLLLALGVLYITTTASATIIVGFDPSDSDVLVGSTSSVNLIATVDGDDSIVSFGLDVTFASTTLDLVNAFVDPAFDAGSGVDFSTDGVIELTGFVSPFSAPLSGSLTLASLTFVGEAIGLTTLEAIFPDFALGLDGFGLPVTAGPPFAVLPDTVNTGTVSVVPEPATHVLIIIGLLAGLSAITRRHKNVA